MSTYFRHLVVISCILAGCTRPAPSSPGAFAPQNHERQSPQPKGGAFDLEAALRREIPPAKTRPLRVDVVEGTVEATGDPAGKREERLFEVEFPIGTLANVTCEVSDSRLDPASLVNRLAKLVGQKQDVREVALRDVYAIGNYIAFSARILYLTKKKEAGELKLYYYANPLVPTLCLHDELGYYESVRRITTGLFASLSRKDRQFQAPPSAWEGGVTKLNGKPIGFTQDITWRSSGAAIVTESQSMKLVPRSPTQLLAEDSFSVLKRSPEGAVLQYDYAEANNGEITVQVSLKRLAGNEYAFSGKQSGKPIAGKFKTKDKGGLSMGPMIDKAMRDKLLSGKAKAFKAEEYAPSVDPTAPLEASYELDSLPDRRIRASSGPVQVKATVDEQGAVERIESNVGAMTLTTERLFSHRSP